MAEVGSLILSLDCVKCLHIQLSRNQNGKQKKKREKNPPLLPLSFILFLMNIKTLYERE